MDWSRLERVSCLLSSNGKSVRSDADPRIPDQYYELPQWSRGNHYERNVHLQPVRCGWYIVVLVDVWLRDVFEIHDLREIPDKVMDPSRQVCSMHLIDRNNDPHSPQTWVEGIRVLCSCCEVLTMFLGRQQLLSWRSLALPRPGPLLLTSES